MSSSLRIVYSESITHETLSPPAIQDQRINGAASISFRDLQQLLADNRAIREDLKTLSKAFATTQLPNRAAARETLDSIQSKVVTNKTFLDRLWNSIPIDRKPSARTRDKALEVFRTPELLEHILLQLSPADILRAQQVGREWRDGVNGSVKLQRMLGLIPSATGFYYSPFAPIDDMGFDVHPFPMLQYKDYDTWTAYGWNENRHPIARGVTNELHFEINIDLLKRVYIGTRSQAMRLFHNPIEEMSINFYEIRDDEGETNDASAEWTADGDITIGRLLDEVHRILYEEDWAVGLDWSAYQVVVSGTVMLKNDDPIMMRRWRERRQAMDLMEWREQMTLQTLARMTKGAVDGESDSGDRE